MFLGAIEGLSFYATVGFREFVNQAYLWPVDRAVIGTLSTLRFVFDLMTCGLLLAFIVAVSFADMRPLFSRKTPLVALIFFASVLASANDDLFIDALILVGRPLSSGKRSHNTFGGMARFTLSPTQLPEGVQVVLFAALGSHFGLLSGLSAFTAAALCVFAARNRLRWCDVILGSGAIASLGPNRHGYGISPR